MDDVNIDGAMEVLRDLKYEDAEGEEHSVLELFALKLQEVSDEVKSIGWATSSTAPPPEHAAQAERAGRGVPVLAGPEHTERDLEETPMPGEDTALAERHTKVTEIDDETGEHFDICSTCGDADWPCVYVQLAGAQKRVDRLRDQLYRYGTRDSHRFWLCKLMPHFWSLRYEWRRILDWRQRHRDGRRYGWIEAWRAVVENPPTFDHYWDQEMEDRCHCSAGPQSCSWLTAVMEAVR